MTIQQKNIYLFFWVTLCGCIAMLYWPSVHSPFVYDDKIEVIGNRTIRDISDWKAIASYNPSRILLQFTYAANLHQSKFDPFGYHILNLIIHCLGIGAALWMCINVHILAHKERDDIDRFPFFPFVVVGLWAVHPMGSESIIYITGRSESLCALFCFLSIGCWSLGLAQNKTSSKTLWLSLGFFLSLCAGTTKEVGLMLPFVLVAMDKICTKNIRWHHYIPFLLLISLGVSLRILGLFSGKTESSSIMQVLEKIIPFESDRSMASQILTQAEIWIRYSLLWIFPYEQTIFHHIPDRMPNTPNGYIGASGWLFCAYFLWKWSKDSPVSRFALVAGALLLLPSSSFVPLKENMAEHRAHQWGLFVFLYLLNLKPMLSKRNMLGLLGLAIPLSIATYQRSNIWKTEEGIWKEAVEQNHSSSEAWYGYGDALRFHGSVVEAKEAFQKSIEIDPSYLDGWINLGITRAQTNDIVGAAMAWKTVLTQKPDVWKPSHCKAHNNLGFLGARAREWEDALREFHSTLAICPDDLIAHYALGELHFDPVFDKKKAIYYYERLLFLDPTFDKAEEVRKKLLQLTW